MFKALVLVRNLESSAVSLDFGEFTIKLVGIRFQELRDIFSSADVNPDDWIFEKSYTLLPLGAPGSPVGGIPTDIEDILLLLRLHRAGDISFIKQTIIPPSGNKLVQFPCRAINDLNSYSSLRFKFESEECEEWKAFSIRIRNGQSWNSDWFAAARRFFLSGGAKPFNPARDDVDRIVDYATALESALVPEKDYNTRRISRRAAALLPSVDPTDHEVIVGFIKKLCEIRSRIVHGNGMNDETRAWLFTNSEVVESRVREILAAAVQQLPPGEEKRRAALAQFYNPTDDDRGNFIVEKFREIKNAGVRKAVAAEIALLARR